MNETRSKLLYTLVGWLMVPAFSFADGSAAQLGAADDSCRRRCAVEAKHALHRCIEDTGLKRACLPIAQEILNMCHAECDEVPNCERLCRKRTEMVKRVCLHQGGSEDDCTARARTFLERCLEAHCHQPPPCEAGCLEQARAHHDTCVADGHPADLCRDRVGEFLRSCLEANCPPPPTCEQRCQRAAASIRRLCLFLGGDADVCDDRAARFLNHCVETHCQGPGCEEGCLINARRAYQHCLEMGEDQQQCAIRAREFLATCLNEQCPTPTPCELRCRHAAEADYRACVEAGEPPDVCAAAAREKYNTCVAEHCPPPPTCEEHCARRAERVLQLCLELGGSNVDCHLRAGAFLTQCLAHGCPQRCGGIVDLPCDDDSFCKFRAGTCDDGDRVGVCRPIPGGCPLVYQPVCGCDGKTYGNECEADAAGVAVDYRGVCGEVCGTIAGLDCPAGSFCRFPPGTCEVSDNEGVCMPMPDLCPRILDPVCGCDGQTYNNRCEAAAAGVSIDHRGECRRICGGILGLGCDDDEYCRLPIGHCCCDFQGVCRPIPSVCTDHVDPVCGCDGVTYFNACEAAAVGVSIDYLGECDR